MITDQRLDRAAWQPLHTRILLALGIGWAMDSLEVQILGSVITPLATEFGLLGADGAIRPWALSTIWTVWFVGLLVGAAGFGWLADRIGRKRLFVVAARRRPARRHPAPLPVRDRYRSGPLFRAEKNHNGGPLRYASAHARWAQYCHAADTELRAWRRRQRS